MMVIDFDDLSKDDIKSYINERFKVIKNTYNLLENLLKWSMSQKGDLTLYPDKHDIFDIVEQTISLLNTTAAKKQIKLLNIIQNNSTGYFDLETIGTVLRNLISNAIKFSNIGSSVVISSVDEEGFIQINVSDKGIGIDEEILAKLFKGFSTFTTRGTLQEKGTGLGLILCREFVEKNNGKIWVESKIGEGTTFSFTVQKPPTH